MVTRTGTSFTGRVTQKKVAPPTRKKVITASPKIKSTGSKQQDRLIKEGIIKADTRLTASEQQRLDTLRSSRSQQLQEMEAERIRARQSQENTRGIDTSFFGAQARGFGRTDLAVKPRSGVGRFVQTKTGGVEGARKVIEKGETVQRGFTGTVRPVTRPVRTELQKGEEAINVIASNRRTTSGQLLTRAVARPVGQTGRGVSKVIEEVEQRPFPTFVQVFSFTGYRSVRPRTLSVAERSRLASQRSVTFGTVSRSRDGTIINALSRRSVGGVEQITASRSFLSRSNVLVSEDIASSITKAGEPLGRFTGTGVSRPFSTGSVKSATQTTTNVPTFESVVNVGGKRSQSLTAVQIKTGSVFGKETIAGITRNIREFTRPVTINRGKDIVAFEKVATAQPSGSFLLRRTGSVQSIEVIGGSSSGVVRGAQLKTSLKSGAGSVQSQLQQAEQLAIRNVPVQRQTFIPIKPLPATQSQRTTQLTRKTTQTTRTLPQTSTITQRAQTKQIARTTSVTRRAISSRTGTVSTTLPARASQLTTPRVSSVTQTPVVTRFGRGVGISPTIRTGAQPSETIIPFARVPVRPRGTPTGRGRALLEVLTTRGFRTRGEFRGTRQAIRSGVRFAQRTPGLQTFRVTGSGSLSRPRGFKEINTGTFKEVSRKPKRRRRR